MQGRTVVTVLHELNHALLADELMLMQHGRIVFHGASSSGHAKLNDIFGGGLSFHQVAGQWVVLGQ
jgi:iron complex transport system ATP-binding protein